MLNFINTAVAATVVLALRMNTVGATRAGGANLKAYLDLARPFTLVAPALGFISGALTAVGAAPREPWSA